MEDVLDEMEATLKKGQRIRFESKVKSELIHSDIQILKNILINLLSNAIKYSPEMAEIVLEITLGKSDLKIVVSDSGIGIPLGEQKNLFQRFFRAGNVTNIEGTGLGLNIVKKYVDLLKGNITFISEEGKGATFNISIPVS